MSNENDDATQLGSIGRHMSKPQQPGNPQARPAFQAPSLPTHPQEQDGDEEGTVLSTHNATPSRPTRPTVPMAQPVQAQPTQSAPTQQPLPQSQSAPVMATRQFPQTTAPSVKPAQPAMASSMMSAPQADITEFHELFAQLVGNVSQVVVGKEQPIRQCATAMIVGGHILLEDNPGTGKTQLARGLANSIDMSFKRIQFTPDLLPSDVVGVTYYDQKNGEFEYREGPIFASIVLADEINRASPKTQSALLEVMEEQKVTVDGETHAVPQPFMVIATQNPIEQLGTYKLPEAQMDRFMMKAVLTYPTAQEEQRMLAMLTRRGSDTVDQHALTGDTVSISDVEFLRSAARRVHVSDAIMQYAVNIAATSRGAGTKPVQGLSSLVRLGASPRASIALVRIGQANALLQGRDYVIPEDVKAFAHEVLRHRILMTFEALADGVTSDQVVDSIVQAVPVP